MTAPETEMHTDPAPLTHVAFDADDTLWHNESLFALSQESFRRLLAPYLDDPEEVNRRLFATEVRNLARYGYGIKGFTLSMIETAVELTEGRVTGHKIKTLIDLAHGMLSAPVELLPGVAETVGTLADRGYTLLLITKGDLFDQESKLARSGLGERFRHVEIVSEKDERTYRAILSRHGIAPERFVMVGNSVRSDVLPVLALGGRAFHVPYAITWAHEHVPAPDASTGYTTLERLTELLDRLPPRAGGAAGDAESSS